MSSICVIGAGVSGLTTAIELLKRGHRVTNLAFAASDATTSSAAAAFWYPFWTGSKPNHSWYRPNWAWESFVALDEFVGDAKGGVTRVELIEYFDDRMPRSDVDNVVESMWWRNMPRTDYRIVGPKEVSGVTCAGKRFQSGIRFRTLVVNMACYLPRLEALLIERGGEREDGRHILPRDLPELLSKYDYVVNCCGLGARELVADEALEPVEGIVVRVAPIDGVDSVTLAHTGKLFGQRPVYIVPRGGVDPDIVLGGTLGERKGGVPRHLLEPFPADERNVVEAANRIRKMCEELEPKLKSANQLSISVGYRPRRKPMVRLELQPSGPYAGRLIHNYGHGGGGVTLSWGCAREVTNWIS